MVGGLRQRSSQNRGAKRILSWSQKDLIVVTEGSYRGHRRILSWSQKDLISRRIRYGAVFILVGGGARLELQKIDDISYDGIRRHFPFRDITFRNGGAERPNSVSGLGCHQMPLIFRQVVDGSPDGPAELLSPDPGIGG